MDVRKDTGTAELEAPAHERGEMEKQAILEAGETPLTPSQVAARLGLDEGEVEELRAGDKLPALPMDGVHVYPAWQFRDREILPDITGTLQALPPHSP